MAANALLAQLVEHLHGKEGVSGSSPEEGFLSKLVPASSYAKVRASEDDSFGSMESFW